MNDSDAELEQVLNDKKIVPQDRVAKLIEFLQSPLNYKQEIRVIRALGKLGPVAKKAIPVLLNYVIQDPPFKGKQDDSDVEIHGPSNAAIAALVQIGPDIIPELIAALGDANLNADNVIFLLSKMRHEASRAIPELVNLLDQTIESVACEAADVLAWIGPDAKAAIPALVKALNADAATRGHVHGALKSIGPATRNEVLPLISVLENADSSDVRDHAIEQLNEIGVLPTKVIPRLVALLSSKSMADSDCVQNVVRLLRQPWCDRKILLQELFRALDSINPGEEIFTMLSEYGPEARPVVPLLIKFLGRNKTCDLASDTIRAIGAAAIPDLVKGIKDAKPQVPEILLILGSMGAQAKAAEQELRKLLGCSEPAVRKLAAETLRLIEKS